MPKESSVAGTANVHIDRILDRCFKWIERCSRQEPRLFFPNGIELIQVRAKGQSGEQNLDFEITIAGSSAQKITATSQFLLERFGRVQQACEDAFSANKDDCNKFVKAVASSLGVTLDGNADAIVAEVQGAPWTYIGNDLEAAKNAANLAAQDKLVIGGLTSGELAEAHGHVVVVVPASLVNGIYPVAYWGSIAAGRAAKLRGVNYAFQHPFCDSVRYGWIAIS